MLLSYISSKKNIILWMSVLVVGTVLSNLAGHDYAVLFGNYAYFPLTVALVAASVWSLKVHRSSSTHRAAWIAFLGFAISWSIAQYVWTAEELFYNMEPFPSSADMFYLVGYPFLLMFLILYLEPAYSGITRKIVVASTMISVLVLVPSLYISYDSDMTSLENSIALAYPVADAVIVIPSIIGIMLFFGGRVSLMLSLVFVGILLTYAGDILFLYLQLHDLYYTGHVMELFFLLSTLFLIFGVLYNVRTFGKSVPQNSV